LRGVLGLGSTLGRGRVVAADDARLGARTLRSERLGLVARPDHLVRLGDGTVIPVEQKPRARQLYQSHVLELGAQLALVEASLGRRPPYGMVVLASGVQRRIAFDRSLEHAVFRAVGQMRAHLESDGAPGRRWLGAKGRACEFYANCWPDHP
jgi:predicted RecB family nuclease